MADESTITVEQGTVSEAIIRSENEKHSFNEESAKGNLSGFAAEDSTSNSKDWHELYVDHIAENAPLESDKVREERQFREDMLNRNEEQAESETEEEALSDEELEEAESENRFSPLDAFAPDDVRRFCDEHGLTAQDLESEAVQQLVASRMSDSQVAAQQAQQPQTEAEKTKAYYRGQFAQMQRLVSDPQVFDPTITAATIQGLAQCFDVETPEDMGKVQNLSSILGQAAIHFASTNVPKLMRYCFPQMLEEFAPGLLHAHKEATAQNAYQDLRSSNPNYKGLPDLGTPEFEQLKAKVVAEHPWIETITFKDGNGQPLHPHHPQSVRQQCALFCRLAAGEQITPEMMKQAVETGKREAASHKRMVTVSRAIGAGKKGTGNRFQAPPANEFRDAIKSYMRSQTSSSESDE